jgi:hypothetical protein
MKYPLPFQNLINANIYPHIASQVFTVAENCGTFPMNTTRTAQYLPALVSFFESKRVYRRR